MFTIKNYWQYVNNLKMRKRQLSITKEKANQKSKPKITSTNVDQLQRKWSLLRPHVIIIIIIIIIIVIIFIVYLSFVVLCFLSIE